MPQDSKYPQPAKPDEPRRHSQQQPPPDLVLSEDDDFPLYDAAQVGRLMGGMSKWWVLKEVRAGHIDYVEQGNRYRFKPRHIREAINRNEVDRTKRGRKTTSGAAKRAAVAAPGGPGRAG